MRSLSDKRIFSLIALLYETAREQSSEAWLDVFKQMAGILSSGPGSLSLYSPDNKQFEFVATTLNKELLEEYNDYFQFISPFRHQIEKMNAGDSFSRAEFYSDKHFLETEIYQNYFKKQDVFNFEYQVLFKESGMVSGVSFSRPETMRNFNNQELEIMKFIIPHLKQAFQIHIKFAQIQRDKQIMSECLERISQSVIVLNKFGKIMFSNESANKLITQKDGLQIERSGVLSTNFPRDSKKLKLLLQSVFEPALAQNISCGGTLQISRPSGLRPLSVFVSPFSEKSSFNFNSEPLALLFINNPEQKLEDVEPILSQMYGLTPAESRLAAILAQGKSLNQACEMLGVKQNTNRTHLKRIFSKTETNHQSELVKLILSNSINMRR
jgi:DNA-binding CsgD family transcriptional regulator